MQKRTHQLEKLKVLAEGSNVWWTRGFQHPHNSRDGKRGHWPSPDLVISYSNILLTNEGSSLHSVYPALC